MGKYAQANLIHATAHRPVDREFEITRGENPKDGSVYSRGEKGWVRMKGIEEAAVDKQIAIDDNRHRNDLFSDDNRAFNAEKLERLRGENALALEDRRNAGRLAEQVGLTKQYSERQKAEVDRLNELLDNARASNKFTADELASMEKQVMLNQLGIVSSPRLTLGEQPFVPQLYKDPGTGRSFLQLQKGGEWVEDAPVTPPSPAPSVTDQDKMKFIQEMIKNGMSVNDAIKTWNTAFPPQKQDTNKPTSALEAAKGNAGQQNNANGGKKVSLSDFERTE